MSNLIKVRTKRRTLRVRSKLAKNIGIPRLTVHRTNRYVWAQIIDDKHGQTLVSSNSKNLTKKAVAGKTKTEKAVLVGQDIAKKALKANINRVRFDRGPYLYHGRIKALAQAARDQGLIL